MTNNCGRSKATEYDELVESQKHKFDPSTFNNACGVQNVHDVLNKMAQGPAQSEGDLIAQASA